MKKHLARLMVIALIWVGTFTPNAEAGPTPVAKGAIVGLATAGGGLGGAAVLGATGIALGGATCTGAPECWAPFVFGVAGATGGLVGGTIAGATLSARGFGVSRAPFARNLMTATGVSVVVAALGVASPGAFALGTTGLVIGVPVVAGLTATKLARDTSSTGLANLTITPMAGRQQRGLIATVSF